MQINTQADKEANLQRAEELIDEQLRRERALLCCRSTSAFLGHAISIRPCGADPGPTAERFAASAPAWDPPARRDSRLSETDGKFYNTSVVVNPQGEIIATYRKIHLFNRPDRQCNANESSTFCRATRS